MQRFGRLHRVLRIGRRHFLYRTLALATLINAALLIGAHIPINPPHAEITNTENGGEHKQLKEPLIDRMLDDPVAVLTIGVVLFTAALVYVTYRLVDSTLLLWQAGERQLEFLRLSAERQTRGYLAIVKHRSTKNRDSINITVKNCGQTPLFNVGGYMNRYWRAFNDPLPDDFDFPNFGPEDTVTCRAVLQPTQEYMFTFPIDSDKIGLAQEKKIQYFIYGRFACEDIFGARQIVRFAYREHSAFSEIPEGSRGVWVMLSQHNNVDYR